MTPTALNRPFIGISMPQQDYEKVKGLLPTPSYKDTLYSRLNQKVILIFSIDGYISSSKQFRWISNIKLGLNDFIFVPFEYEDEYYINDDTEITSIIYSIDELSKAFKSPLITYPKIMYPSTKKELYQHLCWYGKSLIHQKVFTKEAMISAALQMNAKLKDKYSYREIFKKASGATLWLIENIENFNVKLDPKELKKAHAKGAYITNTKQKEKTQIKINSLLKNDKYYKPNGKVNKTLLSNDLGIHRRTLDRYL